MKKTYWKFAPLGLIVLLALVLRLYRIHYPLLDWHSFRQADTASVTREYVEHGIDILRPTYQDHSNIASGSNNPEGYRMVEFPIINALTAALLQLFSFLPLVPTSRFISIVLSLGALVSIYFLAEKISGKRVAVVSALTFAVLPYSIYYSRTILPETGMLFFSTFALLGFYYWLENTTAKWYLLSVLSLAIGLLLKPFVLFLGPVFLALAWNQQGKKIIKNPFFYVYPIIAVLPLIGWREWITRFPEGIPVSDWLYNGNGIRFRPAWFRWLGYERLTKLLLGFVGLIFLPFSVLDRQKDVIIYISWWLGILAYFSVIATGNVQHDYYQVLIIPILSLSVGKGAVLLRKYIETFLNRYTKTSQFYTHWIGLVVVGALYLVMLLLSWQQVKGYFNVNHWEYVTAGEAVDRLTPPDAKVIAPAMGDTAFLFQTKRTGWPIGHSIDEKIEQGATHYVTTADDDEARELSEKYFIIEKTDLYLLIDLTREREEESS